MSFKSLSLVLSLSSMLTLAPAYAESPPDTWENRGQFYGWVASNYLPPVVSPESTGILTVHNPTIGETVRFDYLISDNSGAHALTPYMWVLVQYYLDSEVGCLDGPNTMVRPRLVYRWSDECLCTLVWNKDSHDWVAN